jgi:hypothetical protein
MNISNSTKGVLLSVLALIGVVVGIQLISTLFEERNDRTQEQDKSRNAVLFSQPSHTEPTSRGW